VQDETRYRSLRRDGPPTSNSAVSIRPGEATRTASIGVSNTPFA
jgi:hypothetical protein